LCRGAIYVGGFQLPFQTGVRSRFDRVDWVKRGRSIVVGGREVLIFTFLFWF